MLVCGSKVCASTAWKWLQQQLRTEGVAVEKYFRHSPSLGQRKWDKSLERFWSGGVQVLIVVNEGQVARILEGGSSSSSSSVCVVRIDTAFPGSFVVSRHAKAHVYRDNLYNELDLPQVSACSGSSSATARPILHSVKVVAVGTQANKRSFLAQVRNLHLSSVSQKWGKNARVLP